MSSATNKRSLSIVLLLAMPVVPCAGAESPAVDALQLVTQKLKAGQPLVFATFGERVTLQCYHTDYQQNYITFTTDALRQAYPQVNIRIVHAGNMGTTVRGLANARFERYVLDHRPDVVFIMFGMNDCGGRAAGLDGYDQNLTRLIEMTRGIGAVPVICNQNEVLY